MMSPEQAAAVERYAGWLALWQVYVAADLATLGLPDELITAVHTALAALTSTVTTFTTAAAGLPPPVEVVSA